ncbi:MAG: phenylalanine--tRNA ligase subunit beta [Candidatus Aenigmatarchaeota archaeon]|nr:MAG: phenylalanine--tRNA ligase subunit beta [Candidatus Aenigmarchaeota archaeon]
MPTVTLNKKVFEKLVGEKLPEDKLKDRISMLGTDLEGIRGNEIHVEVFPNRPDMLSEQGFARAFSSFIGVKTGLRKYKVRSTGSKLFVKNLPPQWPYGVACIVRGLKFDDEKIREVIQLQEKLGTTLTRNRRKGGLGLYPLEKIKFPITFTGKKPEDIKFRPLEFREQLTAKQILSRHPKGREYGSIMDGWKTYPVFVDSKGTVMSMPPIINSHDVGKIDETTNDVFIEGTGPDLNTIMVSLAILATSLADMGGEIHSLEIIYPKRKFTFPDLRPGKMKIDIDYCNKWLGLNLKGREVKRLLGRMGFGYENKTVLVPAYRADVMHPVDLFEDVAIAYGYDNFEHEIPNISTIGEEDPFEIFKKKIADLMIGLGFLETATYHLTNREDMNTKMLTDLDYVELLNPANIEYDILRSWVLPSLMKVLSENTRHDYPQKIFDIGTVFKKNPAKETSVEEFARIACVSCHKDANYTEIRQYLECMLSSFGLKNKVVKTEHPSFIPGRVGRVSVKGKKIAYVGELHPQVLENFGIEQPVCAFELNLTDLFPLLKK